MKTNKFSTSDKKKALQKENNEDGDEEDEEEEDDEEDREKIAKKSSQNQISKKSVINKETKITTIRKEEKPKIATQTTQGVYKPRLISTQNQEKNVTKEAGGIRRALKEKRPLHQSDIAQISKKPETLKTSQNTSNTQAKNPVSQTQTKVNAQPQVSKYQNRYTKRQVDSIGNNDDNSKEIKSSKENINDHKKNEEIEDKKEEIKEIKKEIRKEAKKEPRREIKKEERKEERKEIKKEERKEERENNSINKEKENIINTETNNTREENTNIQFEKKNEIKLKRDTEENKDYVKEEVMIENGIEIVKVPLEFLSKMKGKKGKRNIYFKKDNKFDNRDNYYENNRQKLNRTSYGFYKRRGRGNYPRRTSNRYYYQRDDFDIYDDDYEDSFDDYEDFNDNYFRRYNRGRRNYLYDYNNRGRRNNLNGSRYKNRGHVRYRSNFLERGKPNEIYRGFRGRRGRY